MKLRVTISILCLCLFISACMPRISVFYRISLESVAGIEVLQKGKSDIHGLFGDSIVPLKYKLQRPNFIVFFEMSKIRQAALDIRIMGTKNGQWLRIKGVENFGPMVDFRAGRCGNLFVPYHSEMINPKLPVHFKWSKTCLGAAIQKKIAFKVISDSGSVIETEIIELEIVKHGYLAYWDAI